MTISAFFDTNVLIYAFDIERGTSLDLRSSTAEQVLSRGGVVSVQVLNEFCDLATRKFKLRWEKIVKLLEVTEALCGRAIPLTAETHKRAVEISIRYKYRIYDSLIVAAALQAGCTILYTEDMQHGQVIDSVRIENPFLGLVATKELAN